MFLFFLRRYKDVEPLHVVLEAVGQGLKIIPVAEAYCNQPRIRLITSLILEACTCTVRKSHNMPGENAVCLEMEAQDLSKSCLLVFRSG